jgi:hypothetical protein
MINQSVGDSAYQEQIRKESITAIDLYDKVKVPKNTRYLKGIEGFKRSKQMALYQADQSPLKSESQLVWSDR